jgi:aerobic carbon-monoxide dehydrogenase large subunit
MTMKFGFGQPLTRKEDDPLLRGAGRYVADVAPGKPLHAVMVRSPHAHAQFRIHSLEKVRAMPGVRLVLTAADISALGPLPTPGVLAGVDIKVPEYPILAKDMVRHVGDAIAFVVADSLELAKDAAEALAVDWQELPHVVGAVAALKPGAPKVWEDRPNNLAFETEAGDARATKEAFAKAARIVELTIVNQRLVTNYLDTRGVVAEYDGDRYTLTLGSQGSHVIRDIIGGAVMKLPPEKMRVVTPDVGGGFGPKLVFYPEDVAVSVAARTTGRPVKWIEDRREHFVATAQERDQYWDVEVATDRDGRIQAVRGLLVHDHGAWTARGVNVPQGAMAAMPLAYVVPAYRIDLKVSATNKVPVAPVRGAGQPQGVFAMERLLDAAARGLGLDRAEIRRRNLVPADRMPYATPLKTRGGIAVTLDSGDYPRCQQMALDGADWSGFAARQAAARAEGRYVGIGIANYVEGTGRGPYEHVAVRVEGSGRIFVATGAAAMGQSTRTMLAQIVAEQLGGDLGNIDVITGDTAAAPLGLGGSNSRQAVLAGSSAHVAARRVRQRVLEIAGQLLEVAPADLEIEGKHVRLRGVSELAASLAQIARAAAGQAGFPLPEGGGPGLFAREEVVIDAMTYANGSAVAEVEVDTGTGRVTILNLVFAHDCGRVLHPRIVEGQLMGGIAHGIGNALYEYMGYDENAQPLTTNLAEYLLVTATEMPPVKIVHMESPTPLNPLGIKGVGEAGVIPIGAAVASAVEDALAPWGVKVARLPLSPVDVLALLNAAKGG